jgi:hypothetical protein
MRVWFLAWQSCLRHFFVPAACSLSTCSTSEFANLCSGHCIIDSGECRICFCPDACDDGDNDSGDQGDHDGVFDSGGSFFILKESDHFFHLASPFIKVFWVYAFGCLPGEIASSISLILRFVSMSPPFACVFERAVAECAGIMWCRPVIFLGNNSQIRVHTKAGFVPIRCRETKIERIRPSQTIWTVGRIFGGRARKIIIGIISYSYEEAGTDRPG